MTKEQAKEKALEALLDAVDRVAVFHFSSPELVAMGYLAVPEDELTRLLMCYHAYETLETEEESAC